jgi:hypothetical protein
MAKGGSTTNKLNNARGFAKPQTGGSNTEKQIYGVPNVGPTGNNLTGTYSYKKGGMVSRAVQPSCKNGTVRGEDGRCVNARPVQFASGGNVKIAKLAALAAPKNKVTRADIIVGAKRNARKK